MAFLSSSWSLRIWAEGGGQPYASKPRGKYRSCNPRNSSPCPACSETHGGIEEPPWNPQSARLSAVRGSNEEVSESDFAAKYSDARTRQTTTLKHATNLYYADQLLWPNQGWPDVVLHQPDLQVDLVLPWALLTCRGNTSINDARMAIILPNRAAVYCSMIYFPQ